jgi:hypothetical protein
MLLPLPLPLDLKSITTNLNLNLNLPTLNLQLANLNLNPAALLNFSRLSLLVQQFNQRPGEDQLLNGIWIGLLSVEALMVLGVMVRGLLGAVGSSRMRRRRRSSGEISIGIGMGHGMCEVGDEGLQGEGVQGGYYWRE